MIFSIIFMETIGVFTDHFIQFSEYKIRRINNVEKIVVLDKPVKDSHLGTNTYWYHHKYANHVKNDLVNGHMIGEISLEVGNNVLVIDNLDAVYPGFKDRLVEDGRVKPNISVAIDGEIVGNLLEDSLLEKTDSETEIYFVPALSGG